MEKHQILYKYYSNYSGGTNVVNLLPKISNSLGNASRRVSRDLKRFSGEGLEYVKNITKDVANDVVDGVNETLAGELLTDVGKGNNPIRSLSKKFENRWKKSDEYLQYLYNMKQVESSDDSNSPPLKPYIPIDKYENYSKKIVSSSNNSNIGQLRD